MSNKILLILPFWKQDRPQANALARLLADLEPARSELFDFAFIARRDCKADQPTVSYVAKKFNTYTGISQRPEVGWPQGCNGLFFGSMDWALRQISSGKLPPYAGIFNCAADSCPLVCNGLAWIHEEWMKLRPSVKVAGAMVGGNRTGPQGSHINGDCTLFSADREFLFWINKRAGDCIRKGGGHDWILAPEFEARGWANIPGIRSDWKRKTFPESDWEGYVGSGIKWLHGVKDFSLLNIARRKLFL